MNKRTRKFISAAAAAAVIISALPQYSAFAVTSTETAVAQLQNREQVYAIPADAQWNTYDISMSLSGMSVTNTDSENNRSVKYDFSDGSVFSGADKLEFEFDLSMTSKENDSTFSIVGQDGGGTSSDNNNAVIRLMLDKSESSLVIENNDKTLYTLAVSESDDYTVSAKLHAVIDFKSKTYAITSYSSDGTKLYSYTDVPFYNTSMTAVTGVYARLSKNNGSITLSDLAVYKEGETEPTETSGTEAQGNIIYDLGSDTGENKGWTASAFGGAAAGGDISYNEETGTLTLSSTGQGGDRAQAVEFASAAAEDDLLQIDITLTMQADKDGKAGTSAGLYNYFELTDSAGTPVLSLRLGNDDAGETGTELYFNGEDTGISSDTGELTMKVIAVADPAYDTLYVTIMQNGAAVYSANLPLEGGGIAKAVSILHRSSGSSTYAASPQPKTEISELTVQKVTAPKAFVAGTGGSIGDDGVVSFNIEVGETVSMALLRNYNDTVTIETTDTTAAVVQGSSIENDFARADFVPLYDAVTVHGKAAGELGPFSIEITNGIETLTRTFIIKVTDATPEPLPDIEPLENIEPQEELFRIDFYDNDSGYIYFDEYGTTITSKGITEIADTSGGLIYDYDANNNNESVTTENPSYSGISGKAFYSFLNTDKIYEWSEADNRNVAGNGYRGSRLMLDNELVQRTDKIKVSYDFAIYNLVNYDNGSPVGTPLSVSMTSEAAGEAGIPFDFNENHFDEIDADPSNTETISKHLLTFFTGRPKRDTTNGVHWVDMTNKLAYFDPLYATESNPYGQYRDLGFVLAENEYSYFHVDAEVDFYNNIIEFTITKNDGTSSPQTATCKTVIPEHASWNGFIIASNKWDEGNAVDINGKDTEHYAYLDNIAASRIAADKANISPQSVPTARPLPVDAVAFRDISSSAQPGKIQKTDETWAQYDSYELQTPDPYTGYVTYDSETEQKNFTYKIADLASNIGITSYTEFDFYLPKRGSGITLHLLGTKDNADIPGNTISISTAGINSWTNLENYTAVYSGKLECGRWYCAQLVYDLHDPEIQIIVVDDTGTEIANKTVDARNLYDSYYRKVCFNPPAIKTVGDDQEQLPDKQPSMAVTYIANLRIYNRAVVTEYYPEGITAVQTSDDNMQPGDAVGSDATAANSQRLASIVTDFVHDQVGDDSSSVSINVGALPVPPLNSEGKTFSGWTLIYSNGSGADIDNGSAGNNATRLKYAAEYDYLSADSVQSSPDKGYYYKVFTTDLNIMDPNFTTIDWYVYNDQDFRMLGRFDLTSIHTQLSGNGQYRIGYVVYNIPVSDSKISAIPQAHHVPMTEEEKAEPTATPHPEGAAEPGPEATSMPKPSGAPMPDSN